MRIEKDKADIDYNETRSFFENRAKNFKKDNPYSVTMYQDNNKELVEGRNKKEIEKLRPFLKLSTQSKVLDIACGIGRWADALPQEIEAYCGVDFSKELIDIAKGRNKKERFSFFTGAANEVEAVLKENEQDGFNTVLMMGILIYLNDKDMEESLAQIERCCGEHAIICMREPIGVADRLTLKTFFSEELNDNYNAIYRTRTELQEALEKGFLEKGFHISKEGFLFEEDELNNRKETMQYYYVLER